MNKYKKSTIYFLSIVVSCVFLFFSLFIAIGYFLDPLQIFEHQSFDTSKLSSNMRIQARGIIKNCDFDSIIIGTSMLENSSSREASDALGGKFINISLSGSSFYERAFLLNYAFSTKKIEKIIYSLDSVYLDAREERSDIKSNSWSFLYDNNVSNDFKIYLSFMLLRYLDTFSNEKIDLDRPNAWHRKKQYAILFGGIRNWVNNIDQQNVSNFIFRELPIQVNLSKNKKLDIIHDRLREKKAIEYVDKYVLSYVKKFSDTHFYFIFPPYFRYTFAVMRQNKPEDFLIHQEVIMYLVKQAEKYKNMSIYGFENEDFTAEISRYKDTGHYDEKINSLFIHAIVSGKNLLNKNNIKEYLSDCEEKAYNYDINALYNAFQNELKKQKGN